LCYGGPEFDAEGGPELDADYHLLDYLKRARGEALDVDEKRLLLNDNELYRLELTFEGDLDRSWVPSEPVHRRHIETLSEIRDNLSRQTAEEWSEVCVKFGRPLEDQHTRLPERIAVIRGWVAQLRILLRVMGATTLLPAPEGGFPTPTCPRCSLAPEERIVQNSQLGNDTLAATIAEIRDLIVDQRSVKELYTTAEVAEILRRAEYTVREWCRKGQVHAKKASNGRSWLITHTELT
jgi:hypothetical protein